MGKYMRKAKTTGEVAVMDLSLGVRTRAKTLALQRQVTTLSAAPPPTTSAAGYLQLRSRRLEKRPPQPPIIVHDPSNSSKRAKQGQGHGSGRQQKPNSANNAAKDSEAGSRVGFGSGREGEAEEILEESNGENDDKKGKSSDESKDLGVEASFGENALDVDGRERSTRESTPCSLIRDSEMIRTPGSTTRPTSSAETNRRIHHSTNRHIPTAHEMDEFFNGAEEEQQRQFVERYNFDPVNDKPLPGRYVWEKLNG